MYVYTPVISSNLETHWTPRAAIADSLWLAGVSPVTCDEPNTLPIFDYTAVLI